MISAREALPWFEQAGSDLRIAQLLLASNELSERLAEQGVSLELGDHDCHCAAMCSQTLEKSIKGYMIVNGTQPKMNHRPDKYLRKLLDDNSSLLRHKQHKKRLSALFDTKTKSVIRELFDLTPGGLGSRTDVPNTEYPWMNDDAWQHAPKTDVLLPELKGWVDISRRVHTTLYKLAISAIQGASL